MDDDDADEADTVEDVEDAVVWGVGWMVSPGRPTIRLTICCCGSVGDLNTTTSPTWYWEYNRCTSNMSFLPEGLRVGDIELPFTGHSVAIDPGKCTQRKLKRRWVGWKDEGSGSCLGNRMQRSQGRMMKMFDSRTVNRHSRFADENNLRSTMGGNGKKHDVEVEERRHRGRQRKAEK